MEAVKTVQIAGQEDIWIIQVSTTSRYDGLSMIGSFQAVAAPSGKQIVFTVQCTVSFKQYSQAKRNTQYHKL